LGNRIDHYETKRRTKTGAILIVSLTASPIHSPSGAIVGASKVLRDITEQKTNLALQERLSAIVESADDAIISKDLDGIIQTWNRGATRLFGYAAHETIGRHISMLAAPESADEIPQILTRLASGERIDDYGTKRKAKDGSIFTVSLTVSPIRDSSGKIIGASKVVRDITRRELRDRALREANAALSRSNDDLEHFTFSASHDLQEPLRAIKVYSQMLERDFSGKLGPVGERYIALALGGAARMERLLKDLRMYMAASAVGPEPSEQVDAGEVLDRVLETLELALKETGAFITIDISAQSPRAAVPSGAGFSKPGQQCAGISRRRPPTYSHRGRAEAHYVRVFRAR
jgi:PAS domain S-box-containing protein